MATTYGTTSASSSANYDIAVVRFEVLQTGHGDYAAGSDILDLVSKDICILTRYGFDGTGI
mgnify:CR=1 FL=1